MPLTIQERQEVMREVTLQIQKAGYVYELGKGAGGWVQLPPPSGTRLNCQAAARLAKALGEQRRVTELQIVQTHIADGFFVPCAPGVKALGSNEPPVRSAQVCGWEFDNHFRVKDPVANIVYDPTFGTSGNFNPVGVKCTSTQVDFPKMISVYGKKYKITRSNVFEAQLLSQAPVAGEYLVENKDYS